MSHRTTLPALTVVFALSASTPLYAASVGLSSVAETFSQAGYPGSETIDGVVSGSDNGWGVFGGQTTAQSAVFTASSSVSASQLAFTFLHQAGFDQHHIQEFRISTTTDANPAVGSAWTPVTATSLKATGGPTLAPAGGNIRATGAAGTFANYQIVASGSFSGVTGFLLELTPFDSGNGANLGASSNGNFVLSEFVVDSDESINRAFGMTVTSSEPTWANKPTSLLTDGNAFGEVHPTGPGGVPPAVTNPGYYFEVDLGEIIAIDQIQLVPRQDGCCPERLSDYRVEVLDSSFTEVWAADLRTDLSNPGLATETISAGDGTGTFTGQYVRIVNRNGANYNPQLNEIIVNGMPIPEPSSALLGVLGLVFLARHRRR